MTTVAFYLDFVSPYTYFALTQARRFESDHGVRFDVRPVVYAKLLDAAGLVGPAEREAKRRYTFADVLRSAHRLGVPLVGPPAHPFRSLEALVSPELSQVVNLVSRGDGTDVNAQFRGVGEASWAVHDSVKIVEGRKYGSGLREIVVGQGAQKQFRDLDVGSTLTLGNQQCQVVGKFASGDVHDWEIWTDAQTLATTYNRGAWQLVSVRTEGKAGFEQFKAAMAPDPRLKLDVETTKAYYAKQSGQLNQLLTILGTVIGAIMAVGAVFGALNTMYAAVAGRAREIATMRAIGFRGP